MSVNLKHVGALLLVACMTVAAGCASSPFGGGADSVDTDLMDDLLTERKIMRQFADTPELSGETIAVGCVGGVVTLSGTVRSSVEREVAEQVARSIDGVTEVRNNITTGT